VNIAPLKLEKTKPRLIVCLDGLWGSGKTHWIFTSPKSMFYANFDKSSVDDVAPKFVGQPIRIENYWASEVSKLVASLGKNKFYGNVVDKDGKPLNVQIVQTPRDVIFDQARSVFNRFYDDFIDAINTAEIRTITIDTFSEMYNVLRLCEHGRLSKVESKHFAELNSLLRQLITDIYPIRKNVIFVNKQKKEYRAVGSGSEVQWTGRWEMGGFAETPYLVQCGITTYKSQEPDQSPVFRAHVYKCSINIDIEGMDLSSADDMFDFASLAQLVYPDSDEGDWA
jgi:hypothetical protein